MMPVEKQPNLYPVSDDGAIVKELTVNDYDEKYGGHISLFRSIRKHWIWQDSTKLKWWIDILLEVNHKDKKVLIGTKLILCKRGECVVSTLTWAKRWRTTRSSVRRFFKLLESDSMIVLKSDSKTTHLTVCNYDSYQSWRPAQRPDFEHQTNNKVTTTNKYNNDNNKGGFRPPSIDEVKAYIEERCNGNKNIEAVAQNFIDFYQSKKWKVGKTTMADWKAALRNSLKWEKNVKLINDGKAESKGVDMDEYLQRTLPEMPY